MKFTKLAVSYLGELAKGSLVVTEPSRRKFDYDGDGKADISVFRASTGAWYLNQSTAEMRVFCSVRRAIKSFRRIMTATAKPMSRFSVQAFGI